MLKNVLAKKCVFMSSVMSAHFSQQQLLVVIISTDLSRFAFNMHCTLYAFI